MAAEWSEKAHLDDLISAMVVHEVSLKRSPQSGIKNQLLYADSPTVEAQSIDIDQTQPSSTSVSRVTVRQNAAITLPRRSWRLDL